MIRIATHKRPDADAVASAWLAETYLFTGKRVEVVFVPRHRPSRADSDVDCLVDVGNVNDPKRLCFDHKPPAFAGRNESCAAKLVWEHLLRLGHPIRHLRTLVEVIHEGEHSPPRRPSPALRSSRADGFHARVTRLRGQGMEDGELYRTLCHWLDAYDAAAQGIARGGTAP